MSENVVRCMHGETTNYYDRKNDYIEVTSPIFEPGGEDVIGVVLASVSTDNIEVTRHVLLTQGGIITGIVMILLAVVSAFFSPTGWCARSGRSRGRSKM